MLSLFCYSLLHGATVLLQAVRHPSSPPCPSDVLYIQHHLLFCAERPTLRDEMSAGNKKSSPYAVLKLSLVCWFLWGSKLWGHWLYESLVWNLWRVGIRGHMLSSLQPPPSPAYLFISYATGRESNWQGEERGRDEKSLLTHKLVNAVALSTFSSNENFCHLHINLISCVSLSSLPLLH